MRIIYVFILVGVVLVLYLSWLPDPNFRFVKFIPAWVSNWTDLKENGELRTAVPFVFLGLFAGLLPSQDPTSFTRFILLWLALVTVVVVAEVGQLWLPARFFSWEDIGWGAAGGLLGLSMAISISSVRRLRK